MLQFPPWKKILIAVVAAFGILYALPNVTGSFEPFDEYPTWAPGKPMNLGLDLRGGAHLLVQVKVDDVVDERLSATEQGLRQPLRDARIRASQFDVNTTQETITFSIRDEENAPAALNVLRQFAAGYEIEQTGDTRFRLTLPETEVQAIIQRTMSQSLEVATRRVNALGLTEPTIQQQGVDRMLVQVPGLESTDELKDILQTQARLTFHLVDQDRLGAALEAGRPPPGFMIKPSTETDAAGDPLFQYLLEREVMVSGANLNNAQATFQDGRPVVSFAFDTVGAQRFGRATQENVGRLMAALLDDEVISAPQIRDAILTGEGIITGGFSLQEAQQLSLLLRAGALPAEMEFVEERTVGPGLGQDSIDAGSIASIIGLILVVIYMGISYGRFGMYANVALILNLTLIIGILSALGATLTLPGIAGIVLTVGMAVDANVLIFERIREEAGNGRSVLNSIEAGYQRALTTIIDANLTTLIAAVLLFAFGSGPIRGFSITLSIGLLTSMFTAIMVTRFLVVNYVRTQRPDVLPIAAKVKPLAGAEEA